VVEPSPHLLIRRRSCPHNRPAKKFEAEQAEPQARVRRDVIDNDGKLTLRHNGRLHHIGIGRTRARTPILMLINGLNICIIHATTGEMLRELQLNPAVDYQAQGVRKPRPKPN
jgi:hypothetical protein